MRLWLLYKVIRPPRPYNVLVRPIKGLERPGGGPRERFLKVLQALPWLISNHKLLYIKKGSIKGRFRPG